MVQLPLLVALLQDVLLDGVLAHQAVDVHLPRLPDPVAAILGLPDDSRPASFLTPLKSTGNLIARDV